VVLELVETDGSGILAADADLLSLRVAQRGSRDREAARGRAPSAPNRFDGGVDGLLVIRGLIYNYLYNLVN
jgi:hypothetical protein